ncbi:hypothetical protein [Marinicrinis lubricantis]|uniref:Uncharacterized protein n=1 Tax=Marinicrinis lubricantis TaxID=2086470 RepID=A0ABW1IRM1_9BACL
MRTENQIKRKLNELIVRRNTLKDSLPEVEASSHPVLGQLEDQIMLLEWVLNEPTGSYHM